MSETHTNRSPSFQDVENPPHYQDGETLPPYPTVVRNTNENTRFRSIMECCLPVIGTVFIIALAGAALIGVVLGRVYSSSQ